MPKNFTRKDDNDSGVKVKKSTDEKVPRSSTDEKVPRSRSKISSAIKKEPEVPIDDSAPVRRERTPGNRSRTPKQNNKYTVPIIIGAVLVLIVIIVAFANSGGKEQPPAENTYQPYSDITTTTAISEEERLRQEMANNGYGIGEGVGSGKDGQVRVTDDTMLKDIAGNILPEMYTVKAITYIKDIVTYTKYRAVTGVGVELYWLEGSYKEQSCRIIVPYKFFREFPDSGGIVCDIEVVETVDGQKIFTWFSYNDEAHKKLLNNK